MAAESIFGKRYGEILLVRVGDQGPEATVYNTFPLNDCPAELWSQLEPESIAADHNAIAALLNGPRYWLMSHIEKDRGTEQERKSFGGIDMLRQATVALSSMSPAPYTVNTVDRRAVFVYAAGQQVFELIDPDGRRWTMQTYSRTVDPTLDLADLPGLADRLTLPNGWIYQTRTLDAELRIDTLTTAAHVLQDNLANSYSLLA